MESIIQEQFERFSKNANIDFDSDVVDYLGINISASSENIEFKAYCEFEKNTNNCDLVYFLTGNDLIKYFSVVLSDKDLSAKRYDIGLKNRSNLNMEKLFDYLSINVPFFYIFSEEINFFAKMKISNNCNDIYSSLYFLGFADVDNNIDLLKLHFLTRKCEETNVSHKAYKFDDLYYLNYLKNTKNTAMLNLIPFAEEALHICGGNLWMIGFDCNKTNEYKCKIYIKKPSYCYDALIEVCEKMFKSEMIEKIELVKEWNRINRKYKIEGIALCLDSNNVFSINFYY